MSFSVVQMDTGEVYDVEPGELYAAALKKTSAADLSALLFRLKDMRTLLSLAIQQVEMEIASRAPKPEGSRTAHFVAPGWEAEVAYPEDTEIPNAALADAWKRKDFRNVREQLIAPQGFRLKKREWQKASKTSGEGPLVELIEHLKGAFEPVAKRPKVTLRRVEEEEA